MLKLIPASIFMLFGLALIVFHKSAGRSMKNFQQQFSKIEYSEQLFQVGYLVIGMLLVVASLLTLVGVIKF